jgi:hypothetical protein
MKILQIGGIIVVTAITAVCLTVGNNLIAVPPNAAELEVSEESSNYIAPFAMPDEPPKEALMLSEEKSGPKGLETQPAKSEDFFLCSNKGPNKITG